MGNYEKNTSASSASLFGTLMMLKAACVNNPGYVDRTMIPFIRVIQRMAREHLSTTNAEATPGKLNSKAKFSSDSGVITTCFAFSG